MMRTNFELCLFSVDPTFVAAATAAGVDSFIVDWESRGKASRQQGFDTQINQHTVEDLALVRKHTSAHLICRVNKMGAHSVKEIHDAISCGADEILLPMVDSLEEVERALSLARGQAKVGILIETNAAVELAAELSGLPLSRIYVGLNDLAIANRDPNIFIPLASGLLDRIRSNVTTPFGFGGLTLPFLGHPVPCYLLMAEMLRLDCQFSFLRRSFLKDVPKERLADAVAEIREALALLSGRSEWEIYSDQKLLIESLGAAIEV